MTANPVEKYDHYGTEAMDPPQERRGRLLGYAAERFAKTIRSKLDKRYEGLPHVVGKPFCSRWPTFMRLVLRGAERRFLVICMAYFRASLTAMASSRGIGRSGVSARRTEDYRRFVRLEKMLTCQRLYFPMRVR